jgi:hypothetical protein
MANATRRQTSRRRVASSRRIGQVEAGRVKAGSVNTEIFRTPSRGRPRELGGIGLIGVANSHKDAKGDLAGVRRQPRRGLQVLAEHHRLRLPIPFGDKVQSERLSGVADSSVRASKKWMPNMVPIQLVWMEPEDGWLIRRLKGRSDPIRLARMVKQIALALVAECSDSPSARGGWGLKRTTSRSLAFHRQFHPDELDGAEIPVAKFSIHFFAGRPIHWARDVAR